MQCYSYDEAHAGYGDSNTMEANVIRGGYDFAALELIQSRQDQMLSNSGIGARGFTWSNDSFGTYIHASQFAGMNTARVVTTGSWSSPREDFASIFSNDGHAVFGFNTFNIVPTDREFLDGVRNGYAFIEDRQLGSVDHKIDDASYAGRPNSGHNAAAHWCAEPGLNIQSKNQDQGNSGTNGARFGSENFGIAHAGHDGILSQESGDYRG